MHHSDGGCLSSGRGGCPALCMCGVRGKGEISLPSTKVYCDSKTTLKNKDSIKTK